MKLLVDIGNSRVKWALLDKDGLSDSASFLRSKTGIKASLNKAWKKLADIDAVLVANVGGDKLAQQLTEWTDKNWQINPVFINSENRRFGVTNAYEEADKLGVDRWLSLIAARQHARQAQCIIDCGTAITVDIVTKTGQHQGGMILPGLGLMRTALAAGTDGLTEDTDDQEFKTLATNTFSAIQAGTLYTVTATLERIINDLRQNFKDEVRFIISGGDAEAILPLLPDDVNHYPDIVLKGLAFYARQQDKKKRANKKPASNTQDADKANTEQAEAASDESQTSADAAEKPQKPRRRKAADKAQKTAAKSDNADATLPEEAI
jgi:type III pantothenate kinase